MLEKLLAWVAPHECLGCGREGSLLCGDCRGDLPKAAERCYRCHALSRGGRTCPTCRRSSRLYAVYAVTVYDGVAKELVGRLKFSGARSAAADMAELMAPAAGGNALLVHLPTAAQRLRQRGYDQAALLARTLAARTGQPYAPVLARSGSQRQVGASRQQRLAQLEGTFRVTRPYLLAGRTVVLVDDVMTTGASLEAAAAVLKKAGAKRVIGLVFARA